MQLTVGATEVALDTDGYQDQGRSGQILILQNLGGGDVYFDFVAGVSAEDGIKLGANGGYEVPGWTPGMKVYLVSDTEADIRYAVVG